MEEENKNAYSEVIAVLKLLDDEKQLEALPMEMLELLKSKANPEYKPVFSKEIPLDEQNLMPETLSILSWIAMKYWNEEIEVENESEIESETIIEQENEEKVNKTETEITENANETKENVDIEELEQEKTIEETVIEEQQTETSLPVLYKDLKWYQKIKIKIIEFFNRIFKRKNIEMQKNEKEGTGSL